MPELPDVTIYVESLAARVIGQPLEHLTIKTPFVLRSVSPPISAAQGRRVSGVRRLGKRIVLDMGDEMFVVIHLMIAGRLRWRAPGAKMPAG
ncbi:MAG TPA: DNA-formamidopyrimidine glycosylase family protein, partial [Gemmatimonadaceae bacterium]